MASRRGYQAALARESDTDDASKKPINRWKTCLIVLGFVFGFLAALTVGIALYYAITAWLTNQEQDKRILTGEIRTTNLEADLAIEMAERIAADGVLQAQLNDRLASINLIHGENVTHNIDLVANNSGITVSPDPDNYRILFENNGVLDINNVPPTLGTIFIEGTGMIDIISTANTSTITVDGSAIATSLANLQMQVSMQQIEIMELQTNTTTVQMVIDALSQALMDLGSNSTDLATVISQLVSDVAMAKQDIINLQEQLGNTSTPIVVAAGSLIPWSGTSGGPYPTGWLLCDGTEYNIVDYTDLHAVIGTMYCPGPCSGIDKFAVPDMRGRVVVHKGGTALNGAIATQVGAETHTLSTVEMPVHTHTGTTSVDGDHSHTYSQYFDVVPYTNNADGYQGNSRAAATSVAGAHSHTMSLNSAGSGGAHNNIQPSMIMQYLIKT